MPNLEAIPEYIEFKRQSVDLQHTEPLSAELSEAYATLMETVPGYANWIADISEDRRTKGPFSETHSTKLKSYLGHELMLERDPLLKRGFLHRNGWLELLEEVYVDDKKRVAYEIDHSYRNPVTSKPTRYSGALIIAGLMTKEHGEPFRHVDIGCGPNVGLAFEKLFMSGDYPADTRKLPTLPTLSVANSSERRSLAHIFEAARSRDFQQSFGVDIFHPLDEVANKWSIACQVPSALVDRRLRRQRATLEKVRDAAPDIGFILADASSVPLQNRFPRNDYPVDVMDSDYQADLATAFYEMYMLKHEQRMATFDTMKGIARFVAMIDAVSIAQAPQKNRHPIDQLKFAKTWDDWSTALLLYDRDEPKQGWQEIARFRDGSCREIMPEDVLLSALRKAA